MNAPEALRDYRKQLIESRGNIVAENESDQEDAEDDAEGVAGENEPTRRSG